MPTLSEADSKRMLAAYGVEFPEERQVFDVDGAVAAARDFDTAVVVKLGASGMAHKTERGLVRLDLRGDTAVAGAARSLLAAARPEDGDIHLLVAPMVLGNRELIAGLHRDPQFGMTVMVGVGGILAEAVSDVAFRLVPVDAIDAREMIDELSCQGLLAAVRGEPAVDRAAMVQLLMALSRAAEADPRIVGVDLNPLIVVEGRPVAVDALVALAE